MVLVSGALVFGTSTLKSQFPGQAAPSPVDALKAMKVMNASTLQKQEGTLKTLDVMTETAQQIKIFAKRS